MKKNLITKMLCLTLCGCLLLPTTALAAPPKTAITTQKKFSSYDDPILRELIKEMGLTKEEVDKIDREIDAALQSRVIGIDDIVNILTLVQMTYQGGRYAARQCEVRYGLTKSDYLSNRNYYLGILTAVAAISPGFAIFKQGFDDYFRGV